MLNIKRLENMLKNPLPAEPPAATRALPPSRYLRDPRQYALPSVELEDHGHQLALPVAQRQGEIQ